MNWSRIRPHQNALAFLLLIGIAVLIGYWRTHEVQQPLIRHAMVLPEPKPLSPFALHNQFGQKFSEHDLEGHWSFVFFGYTHCPSICPATLAVMNAVATQLPSGSAQFVFISADPIRDSDEQLQQYLGHINSGFIGATGDRAEVQRLAKSFNLYLSNENDPTATYIDHSSALLLISPKLELTAIFTPPSSVEDIIQDFNILKNKPITE